MLQRTKVKKANTEISNFDKQVVDLQWTEYN